MKKKRRLILIGFCLTILLVTLIIVLCRIPKDYSISYEKDGYKIKEQYRKDLDMYYFSISSDNHVFENAVKTRYLNKKRLIDGIKTYKSGDVICLFMESKRVNTYPSCFKNDESISYSLGLKEGIENFYKLEKAKFDNIKYKNIDVKSLFDKTVLFWNTKGFYYINSKDQKEIKLLDNEYYFDNKSFRNGRYVILPNYDEKYAFKTFYVLDLKNGKVKTWELEEEISYNFYYLGTHNDKIYLVDRKNKKEYELDVAKRKIENVTDKNQNGKVWNGKWESVSMTKLVNVDYAFSDDHIYNYSLNDNKLYLEYYKGKNKVLLSDLKVDKIVSTEKDGVFYLAGDSLYYYSFIYGENLVMKYSEWNFNKENPIYIY